MRLGEDVTEEDVAEAVRLMTAATLTAATNPETGEIDMDLITTGRSATDRERIEQISQVRLYNCVLPCSISYLVICPWQAFPCFLR